MADNILSDFGINILEEEIDDVIFQTNEFLTDATFTGSQGPFWWILQMCMALAALFSIIVAASMAYKMMVKNEPLDVMKLFKPLVVSIILCWWYPPADTGMTNSGSSWCVLDFYPIFPIASAVTTHDLYEAEATQISDKFEEVQQLVYVRDSMYTDLQAQADVAHKGTSDPNLIEATMEQTGVDEVTNMGEGCQQTVVHLTDGRGRGGHRQDSDADSPDRVPHRLVGDDILSADIARNAHYIRSNTMGIFVAAQVGRSVGEVANPLFDSSFLRSHALLRRFLRPVAV